MKTQVTFVGGPRDLERKVVDVHEDAHYFTETRNEAIGAPTYDEVMWVRKVECRVRADAYRLHRFRGVGGDFVIAVYEGSR